MCFSYNKDILYRVGLTLSLLYSAKLPLSVDFTRCSFPVVFVSLFLHALHHNNILRQKSKKFGRLARDRTGDLVGDDVQLVVNDT